MIKHVKKSTLSILPAACYQLRLTAGRDHWHWSQGGRSVRVSLQRITRNKEKNQHGFWMVLFSEIPLDALEVEDFVWHNMIFDKKRDSMQFWALKIWGLWLQLPRHLLARWWDNYRRDLGLGMRKRVFGKYLMIGCIYDHLSIYHSSKDYPQKTPLKTMRFLHFAQRKCIKSRQ